MTSVVHEASAILPRPSQRGSQSKIAQKGDDSFAALMDKRPDSVEPKRRSDAAPSRPAEPTTPARADKADAPAEAADVPATREKDAGTGTGTGTESAIVKVSAVGNETMPVPGIPTGTDEQQPDAVLAAVVVAMPGEPAPVPAAPVTPTVTPDAPVAAPEPVAETAAPAPTAAPVPAPSAAPGETTARPADAQAPASAPAQQAAAAAAPQMKPQTPSAKPEDVPADETDVAETAAAPKSATGEELPETTGKPQAPQQETPAARQTVTAKPEAGAEQSFKPDDPLPAHKSAAETAQQPLTPAPAHAATATAAATPQATPVSAAQPIPINALAVEIAGQARAGNSRFEIRLDPPELGRIDVRLDVDREGNVTSRLVIERADTYDLLRRDQSTLERALQQAGLKTSDNALEFSLRDQGFARERDDEGSARGTRVMVAEQEMLPGEAASGYGRLIGGGGGLDIRV